MLVLLVLLRLLLLLSLYSYSSKYTQQRPQEERFLSPLARTTESTRCILWVPASASCFTLQPIKATPAPLFLPGVPPCPLPLSVQGNTQHPTGSPAAQSAGSFGAVKKNDVFFSAEETPRFCRALHDQ